MNWVDVSGGFRDGFVPLWTVVCKNVSCPRPGRVVSSGVSSNLVGVSSGVSTSRSGIVRTNDSCRRSDQVGLVVRRNGNPGRTSGQVDVLSLSF